LSSGVPSAFKAVGRLREGSILRFESLMEKGEADID
jgi:hypothetical protein